MTWSVWRTRSNQLSYSAKKGQYIYHPVCISSRPGIRTPDFWVRVRRVTTTPIGYILYSTGSTGIEPVLRESKARVLPLNELPSGKNRTRTCTAWSFNPSLYHWSYLPRWVHRAIILIARWYGLAKVAYLLSADMYELLHYVLACKHANICNTHAYAPHMRPWLNFAQKNRLPY